MLDLNSDLGESFGRWVLGDDEAMLGLVTSANVACGFHAGDATTLRRTCALAAEGDVVVGAQVAYRDLAGFGRRFIDVEPGELTDDVLYQIGALEGLCRVAGTRVRYVKPHGALYNATVHHEEQARAVARPCGRTTRRCRCSACPAPGCSRRPRRRGCARCRSSSSTAGTRPRARSFRGRRTARCSTTRRRSTARVVRMVEDGVVTAVDGTDVAVRAESACVHGDSPGAVAMAAAVRDALAAAGVELHAFV